MRNNTVKTLTIQALIAAIYVVLTVAIAPFSYGAVQFRISESLSQLVVFSKKYWFPITLGVAIANIFSPLGIVDVFFGTLGTGLALAISVLVFKFIKNILQPMFHFFMKLKLGKNHKRYLLITIFPSMRIKLLKQRNFQR